MVSFAKTISVTLTIAVLTLLAFAFPWLGPIFEYQTTASPIVQPWQLMCGHLMHWSTEHLFWDLTMFVVLGAICERVHREAFVVVLLASAIFIPIAVSLGCPSIETYRGLSGIDTALFGLATTYLGYERLRERDTLGVVLFIGLLLAMFAKIGYEMFYGSTLFVESTNFVPVPIAHFVGAAIGILGATRLNTITAFAESAEPMVEQAS